jgi:hypothetical protein
MTMSDQMIIGGEPTTSKKKRNTTSWKTRHYEIERRMRIYFRCLIALGVGLVMALMLCVLLAVGLNESEKNLRVVQSLYELCRKR